LRWSEAVEPEGPGVFCEGISAGAGQDGFEAGYRCGPRCGWLPARPSHFPAVAQRAARQRRV